MNTHTHTHHVVCDYLDILSQASSRADPDNFEDYGEVECIAPT